MLRELHIANFAIIDEMEMSFGPGMNVLTGETGAGKSIITRAIGLLCGDRASADLIRDDRDEAEIEGLFDGGAAESHLLAEAGLPTGEDLVVRRVITLAGTHWPHHQRRWRRARQAMPPPASVTCV